MDLVEGRQLGVTTEDVLRFCPACGIELKLGLFDCCFKLAHVKSVLGDADPSQRTMAAHRLFVPLADVDRFEAIGKKVPRPIRGTYGAPSIQDSNTKLTGPCALRFHLRAHAGRRRGRTVRRHARVHRHAAGPQGP